MPRSAQNRSSARWPFWLLIAAWICANSPQSAAFVVLTWLNEAGQFTHQQRLTSQVALLLTGEKEPDVVARAVEKMPKQPLPSVPPDTVVKKIELGLEKSSKLLAPALRASRPHLADVTDRGRFRAPPLLGPPRVMLSA